jgi:23S rRNA pseudouridine1911/1915/1917 synthase
LHTAPLREGEENTLLDWAARRFPDILLINGRKKFEGGLVHRLDFETQGLVLCARTNKALKFFVDQQEKGLIVKEYEALTASMQTDKILTVIESSFRPYGKGRKEVRPVPVGNPIYKTEILSCEKTEDQCFFRLRISKGYRHQIRCHMAWIGQPIVNDYIYGNYKKESGQVYGKPGMDAFLALRASSIAFNDPDTGKRKQFTI